MKAFIRLFAPVILGFILGAIVTLLGWRKPAAKPTKPAAKPETMTVDQPTEARVAAVYPDGSVELDVGYALFRLPAEHVGHALARPGEVAHTQRHIAPNGTVEWRWEGVLPREQMRDAFMEAGMLGPEQRAALGLDESGNPRGLRVV